jgi:uncharacterized protein YkuJ
MNTKLLILVITLILPFWVKSQNPESIIQKSIDLVSFEAFEMTSILSIYDHKGNVRVRNLSTTSRMFGSTTKILVKFTSPSEVKGTSILIHDYLEKASDMWIFLPSTRKTRRVSGRERGSAFMGSEFTNGNMSTPSLREYDYKLLGSEVLNGKECHRIEVIAKAKQTQEDDGYYRQISYIEKASNLCLKVEFYDMAKKLFKTQTLLNYKKQSNGKYFCYKMEMKNEISGRRSVIEIHDFKASCSLDENAFAPSALQ